MVVKAKLTGNCDDCDRPIAINTVVNEIYVDINLGVGKANWHTVTPGWGEPCFPIEIDLVED